MKRIFLTLIFLGIGLTSIAQSSPDIFPGVLMVKLKKETNFLAKSTLTLNEVAALTQGEIKPIWDDTKHETLLANRPGLLRKSTMEGMRLEQEKASLQRIYQVKLASNVNLPKVLKQLNRLEGVEYAEPLYIRTTLADVNDPITLSAGYVRDQKFFDAWDVADGEGVVIAIVDSGVDYTHPDLVDKLWINEGEIPDNGIDDDRNGYIDDDKGWDFWQSGTTFSDLEEDNDPMGEYSDHGTHVAGIATATHNNEIGLAGAGFKAKFMALKAGGTQQNPRSIGFGYQAMLYAAQMGAHVINNSWGGGGFSNFENDIVNFCMLAGSTVISASGNDGSDAIIYPAAYKNGLAVGSFARFPERSGFSNYGISLDVMASGSNIQSTVFNEQYAANSGTSMASPFAAGLAALVKSKYPDWSAFKVANQLRATATNADLFNPGTRGLNGKGIINAMAAVSTPQPGIRVLETNIFDTNGNKLGINIDGKLEALITNVGEPTANAQLSIATSTENVTLSNPSISLGALQEGDTVVVQFDVKLEEGFSLQETPIFTITMTDGSYSDFNTVIYDKVIYDNTDVNNIYTTFASDGTIGYSDPANGGGGVGFIVKGDDDEEFGIENNLLYSSSLMIHTRSLVADRAAFEFEYDNDLAPEEIFIMNKTENAAIGTGKLSTAGLPTMPRLEVEVESHAYNDENRKDAVYVKYTVTNRSAGALNDVYIGIFADWDIDDFSQNVIEYDAFNEMLYIYDESTQQHYAGIIPMSTISSLLAIDNAFDQVGSGVNFGVYFDPDDVNLNGFTPTEKITSMIAGKQKTTITEPSDLSMTVASGPFTVGVNESFTTGFIMVHGTSEAEIKANALNALVNKPFEVDNALLTSAEDTDQLPFETALHGAYPNPFNPSTNISFSLASTGKVQLEVYNLLGQKVASLANRTFNAGEHAVSFQADGLGSGVYFVRMVTNTNSFTQKITVLK